MIALGGREWWSGVRHRGVLLPIWVREDNGQAKRSGSNVRDVVNPMVAYMAAHATFASYGNGTRTSRRNTEDGRELNRGGRRERRERRGWRREGRSNVEGKG